MEINVKLLNMPFFLGVVSSYALEYVHLRMPALSLHGGFRYQSDVSLFVQKKIQFGFTGFPYLLTLNTNFWDFSSIKYFSA